MLGSSLRARAITAAVIAAGGACAILTPVAVGDTTDLAPNWQVSSSASVTDAGAGLSQAGFDTASWLKVKTNDANAVGCEVAAELQSIPASDPCGADNIFYGENITTCQGAQPGAHSAPLATSRYAVPWWFRTEFTPNLQPGQSAELQVRGIMGKADLWVNGTQVSTEAVLQGSEPEYDFDITSLIKPGANAIALKLYPNNPGAMLNQDFNDWTQAARDQNTGLKYPVRLHVSNALALSDAHVNQVNAADMSSCDLTLKGTVKNTTASAQTGDVDATITDPSGGNPIKVHQTVSLAAGESKTLTFAPVHIANPKLWWPYQMGDQPLYKFTMKTSQGATTSDTATRTFGIRTVTTWLSAKGTKAYNGSRWFAINGKPFVFRGGGMMDSDMFLRYSKTRLDHEVSLIKAMGLNGLRLEGDDQPDSFYDEMDKQGLLVYGGYLCCNYWEDPSSWTAKDLDVNYNTALTLGRQQRNHPSVIFYSWSDETPGAAQEAGVIKGMKDADFDIPITASAEYKSTTTLGPSGMKEGPYNWFPPSYAYSLNCSGSTGANPCTSGAFVNRGGAWAFETESSPGSTIPTLDSLNRFMPPAAQQQMITSPNLRLFNSGRGGQDSGTSYASFQHVGVQATAICRRYGTWTAAPVTCPTNPPGTTNLYANSPNITDFVKKGVALNYESVRAQFEAYIDHSTRTDSPSTGLVYWMMNKPMPSLLWNLYNHDYDQAGSYFGAKKANTPLHVYYSYAAPENDPGNRMVNVANLTGSTQSGLTVSARTIDMAGNVIDAKDAWNINLPSQGVMNQLFQIPNPTLPAGQRRPAADVLPGARAQARDEGDRPQRVLAVDGQRHADLHRQRLPEPVHLRRPAQPADAAAGPDQRPAGEDDAGRLRHHARPGRAPGRPGHGDRRAPDQQVEHRRLPRPRRRPARRHRRQPGPAGQLQRQLRDAVARPIADDHGDLQGLRRRRRRGGQRLRPQPRHGLDRVQWRLRAAVRRRGPGSRQRGRHPARRGDARPGEHARGARRGQGGRAGRQAHRGRRDVPAARCRPRWR